MLSLSLFLSHFVFKTQKLGGVKRIYNSIPSESPTKNGADDNLHFICKNIAPTGGGEGQGEG